MYACDIQFAISQKNTPNFFFLWYWLVFKGWQLFRILFIPSVESLHFSISLQHAKPHREIAYFDYIIYSIYIYIYVYIYIYIFFFFTNFACPHMTPKMGFVTVACESLGTPCRICENVNNFNKIREIIQNACYFYLVLSWVRHFT